MRIHEEFVGLCYFCFCFFSLQNDGLCFFNFILFLLQKNKMAAK